MLILFIAAQTNNKFKIILSLTKQKLTFELTAGKDTENYKITLTAKSGASSTSERMCL